MTTLKDCKTFQEAIEALEGEKYISADMVGDALVIRENHIMRSPAPMKRPRAEIVSDLKGWQWIDHSSCYHRQYSTGQVSSLSALRLAEEDLDDDWQEKVAEFVKEAQGDWLENKTETLESLEQEARVMLKRAKAAHKMEVTPSVLKRGRLPREIAKYEDLAWYLGENEEGFCLDWEDGSAPKRVTYDDLSTPHDGMLDWLEVS